MDLGLYLLLPLAPDFLPMYTVVYTPQKRHSEQVKYLQDTTNFANPDQSVPGLAYVFHQDKYAILSYIRILSIYIFWKSLYNIISYQWPLYIYLFNIIISER